MQDHVTVGIIISTYNNPKWLEKTLWGYMFQVRKADEIIIADDGSTKETRLLIDNFKSILPIKHVWHEDNGFQKTRILNKAILASKSEYLIFTDQDCIPQYDFIATHCSYVKYNYFLSGGYFKLPMDISIKIKQKDVKSRDVFSFKWLREHGLKLSLKCTKLIRHKTFSQFMNTITPAKASWNGCNSSAWRNDILTINGFNEDMQYGGEDREFGERLIQLGIKAKQIRYSAIVLHLDHNRPYKNTEAIKINNAIRKHTQKHKLTKTLRGINLLDAQ